MMKVHFHFGIYMHVTLFIRIKRTPKFSLKKNMLNYVHAEVTKWLSSSCWNFLEAIPRATYGKLCIGNWIWERFSAAVLPAMSKRWAEGAITLGYWLSPWGTRLGCYEENKYKSINFFFVFHETNVTDFVETKRYRITVYRIHQPPRFSQL